MELTTIAQPILHTDRLTAENVGSSRVMEKIGMVREGMRRKAFLLKGQPVDLVDYTIVR